MVRIVMLFGKRADLSMEEFKAYYEEKHVKLVESLIRPTAWPKQYTRSYFDPSQEVVSQSSGQPVTNPLPYHVMTEMTFDDPKELEKLNGAYMANAAALQADEANFLDREKMSIFIADDRRGPQ